MCQACLKGVEAGHLRWGLGGGGCFDTAEAGVRSGHCSPVTKYMNNSNFLYSITLVEVVKKNPPECTQTILPYYVLFNFLWAKKC